MSTSLSGVITEFGGTGTTPNNLRGYLKMGGFAGWYGGYASGDSWKLSSGIIGTKEFEDRYEFLNHSGSLYICYKASQGMSGYMGSIMHGWVESSKEDPSVTIRLLDLETETI